jgi:hypothetical protein
MHRDPIVAEIRRIREEFAARFNYDLDAILDDARQRYAAGDRKVIRRPPRRPLVVADQPWQRATRLEVDQG